MDNRIFTEYQKEIIIFLYFCSLECQTIIKFLKISADSDFSEIDKIYDALQRGQGGKVFTSKTHQATIKKGKLCVTTVS